MSSVSSPPEIMRGRSHNTQRPSVRCAVVDRQRRAPPHATGRAPAGQDADDFAVHSIWRTERRVPLSSRPICSAGKSCRAGGAIEHDRALEFIAAPIWSRRSGAHGHVGAAPLEPVLGDAHAEDALRSTRSRSRASARGPARCRGCGPAHRRRGAAGMRELVDHVAVGHPRRRTSARSPCADEGTHPRDGGRAQLRCWKAPSGGAARAVASP